MIQKDKIISLVEEKLTDEMFIVDITVSTQNAIMVLIDSDKGITVEQCIGISRQVEFNLDREEEDFSLEVSSPGLTEPFKVLRQYKKYVGRDIEVETLEDQKLTGLLKSVTDEGIEMEVTTREKVEGKKKKQSITRQYTFSFDAIKSAKCVISFK